MELLEKLKKDMVVAMKEKNKERLTVIRMLKASLDKERIDKKIEITDEVFLKVLEKEIKLRKDSKEEFLKASREDLVVRYFRSVSSRTINQRRSRKNNRGCDL